MVNFPRHLQTCWTSPSTPFGFVTIVLLVFSFANHVAFAKLIPVKVGDNGQFYTPNNFTANRGDIINFQFVGTAHSVVQTNSSAPCQPLANETGFDSGFAGLAFGGSLSRPMQWNLTITDDSIPIWFYCKSQQPEPHCQAGMVGVINPPNITVFEQYINASRIAPVFPPPKGNATHNFNGVGATASTTPLSLPTPSSTFPPHTHSGTIIGSVLGGVAALTVLFGLIFSLIHMRRKARTLEKERLAVDFVGSSWLSHPSVKNGWRRARS